MLRKGVALAALLLVACGGGKESSKDEGGGKAEQTASLDRACASEETYGRLKQLLFDEAARIRGGDAAMLDRLSDAAYVAMENPVVREHEAELGVTTCAGRFVLELPEGDTSLGTERRLSADVEYAAQTAEDGSGLVYQMEGAEPIIQRLAGIGGARVSTAQAEPVTIPSPSAPPGATRQIVAPPPAPAPAPAAEPARPRPKAQTPPAPQVQAEPRREASAGARPSFNCRYARSRSEQMVCTNGSLAALDRRMSAQFYSALARADPGARARLRRSRDRFLSFRERCGSEACVAQAYRDRMDEIADLSR